MINPVDSKAPVLPVAFQKAAQSQQQAPAQQNSEPQDIVQLSPAAQKAGDVDHDGDSH